MKKPILLSGSTLALLAACANPDAPPTAPTAAAPNFSYELAVPGNSGDTPAKVHWARGMARGQASTSLLTNHGGPVMSTVSEVRAIYWGSSWTSTNAKIAGLASFYSGLGGSGYAKTNTEYAGPAGTYFNAGVTYNSKYIIDNGSAPKNGSRTSTILNEVCSKIGSANVQANGFYPVYVDSPRGHAGYCAWHSAGTCGGKTIQFAFFFNLDNDPGCDPGAPYYSHPQGLAALANVSGHEISEAVTDPHLDAWYDASGAENADKCAWTFSGSAVKLGSDSWKIQGNFSNRAYGSSKGYDGGGCVDGNQSY